MTYRIDFIFGANWCSINNVGATLAVAQIKGHPDKIGIHCGDEWLYGQANRR